MMRIGKNELEIMEVVNRNGGRVEFETLKGEFKPDRENDSHKSVDLSRALHSLTEKELVAVYAVVQDWGSWEYYGAEINKRGRTVPVMMKPYDGKMSHTPPVEMYLGLTEKGKKELENRL